MKQLVQLAVMVEVKPQNLPKLNIGLRQLGDSVKKFLRLFDVKVLAVSSGYRAPSREESIAMTPRAVHYGADIWGDCTSKRSFPRSRVTDDWRRVTCKKCLKKKPQGVQKELF